MTLNEIAIRTEIACIEDFMARLVQNAPVGRGNLTIIYHDEPRRFSISVKFKDEYCVGSGKDICEAMQAFNEAAVSLLK